MGRLTAFERGTVSQPTWPDLTAGREWNLDGMGNWAEVRTEIAGLQAVENEIRKPRSSSQ